MSILSRQYDFLYQTRYVYHPVAELTDRESRARSSLVCLSSDKVDSWMASCAMRRASARQCSTSRCSINRLHSHHTHSFNGPLSRTTWVSWYRKGKPIWILLKQETVSGSGISWAICKSAPRSRQITTPASHHSVFTGQTPFLPPNQQRQTTEATHPSTPKKEHP